MGRIFDKDGLNCIEPPATTPTPRSSPTHHHSHIIGHCHLRTMVPAILKLLLHHPSMAIFQANTYPRPISCKSSGSHVCLRYLLSILPERDTLKIVLFSASTTLIVFVMITLILFGVLRIFDPARVSRLTQDLFSQKI